MKKKITLPNGFTLIELIFATAILGFMLTITLTTFIGVFRFYVWSGVTRTNQSAARELLSQIARDVAERNIVSVGDNINNQFTSVCLAQTTPGSEITTIKIKLTGTTVTTTEYSDNTCTGTPGTTKIISNQTMNISSLGFEKIDGALNNPLLLPSANQQLLRSSLQIRLTTTNGIVDPSSGKCRPADNFCDQSSYITAITERQGG